MLKVLVCVPFTDKYTGEVYEAGKEYTLSEERVEEIKNFNVGFVEVLGLEKPKKTKK